VVLEKKKNKTAHLLEDQDFVTFNFFDNFFLFRNLKQHN